MFTWEARHLICVRFFFFCVNVKIIPKVFLLQRYGEITLITQEIEQSKQLQKVNYIMEPAVAGRSRLAGEMAKKQMVEEWR